MKPNTSLKKVNSIPEIGDAYYLEDGQMLYSFDETVNLIKKRDLEFPSAKDLAILTIIEGNKMDAETKESNPNFVNKYFYWGGILNEGMIYLPKNKDKRILVRESPLIKNPDIATESRKNKRVPYLPKNFNLEKEISKEDYLCVKKTDQIPTNRFKGDSITNFLFKEMAEEYGYFLKECGIITLRIFSKGDSIIDRKMFPFSYHLEMNGMGPKDGVSYLRTWHNNYDYFDWPGGTFAIKRNKK